jgi:hypothetical protein
MPHKDVGDLTARELCELAAQVRAAKPGTIQLRKAADRMAAASWMLEGSGALGILLWWATSDEAEPPPDAR